MWIDQVDKRMPLIFIIQILTGCKMTNVTHLFMSKIYKLLEAMGSHISIIKTIFSKNIIFYAPKLVCIIRWSGRNVTTTWETKTREK